LDPPIYRKLIRADGVIDADGSAGEGREHHVNGLAVLYGEQRL
jgi:hypothetical protein